MSEHRPPRALERVLEWALPAGLSGQGTLGDLAEEFTRRARASGWRARAWYLAQVASIVTYRVLTGDGGATRTNSAFLMDLRWSLRSLLRHPGFSLGVVAVLGLGLGANAAVYSVVDGTIRNTVWWGEPDRTVSIWPDRQFSYGHMELYSDEQSVYRSVGGYMELAFALRSPDGESESVNGVVLTPALFRELAVQPTMGRALTDEDGIFGTTPVVVVGEALWRRSLGADPDIVGKTLTIGGQPVTVVGVQGAGGMAPGGRAELWFPLVMDPRDDDFWKAQSLFLVGVLNDGAGFDDAFRELSAFNDRLSQLFPMFYPPGFAEGLENVARADETQRRMISTPLLLLLGGTALLMLVTALNVGNLLLCRAIDRRKELAVRASLGAGRGRIVRQLLVEGLVLTALAFGVGLLSGSLGSEWIAGLFVGEAVVASRSVFSPGVLLFSGSMAAIAWLVLNGVPIAHFLRSQRGGLNVKPASAARTQRSLVAVQAALATLLLVSAALLVATVGNLRNIPLGFESGGLVAVELSPPEDRVADAADARDLYDRLVRGAVALPGVQAAGLTGWLPLRQEAPTTPINLRDDPVDPAQAVKAPMQMVDPGFFDALGVTPLEGRLLGTEDRADEPSAVVVNETMARLLWPDGSAVGQLIAIDPHAWDTWVPVVGVIPDVRSGEIVRPPGPAIYVALAESPSRDVTLVVRSSQSDASVMPLLRSVVDEADPLVPIRSIEPMADVVRAAYSTSWVMMGLLIVLALLATGLGAVGIYAVLAHQVAANKKEIGVRMALGAQPTLVVRELVRSGIVLAGIGILVGSIAAAWSSRLLESLLFEVTALSPLAYVAPAVALAAAAALAAWVPAMRAARLPPSEVLRSD